MTLTTMMTIARRIRQRISSVYGRHVPNLSKTMRVESGSIVSDNAERENRFEGGGSLPFPRLFVRPSVVNVESADDLRVYAHRRYSSHGENWLWTKRDACLLSRRLLVGS